MIYDHERDAEAERERSLPDWGGDDLFASVPRRRIGHTSRPRRFSGPATGAHAPRRPEPVAAGVPATADGAHDGRVHQAEAARVSRVAFPSRTAGQPPAGPVAMPRPLPLPPAVAKAVAEEADPFASFVADLAPSPAGATSAPAEPAPKPAPRPRRRRESPPIHERFAVRPDRIAGWAVGLGITLILIAVGTADGGAI
jgi:hypothetical protein